MAKTFKMYGAAPVGIVETPVAAARFNIAIFVARKLWEYAPAIGIVAITVWIPYTVAVMAILAATRQVPPTLTQSDVGFIAGLLLVPASLAFGVYAERLVKRLRTARVAR